MPDVIIVGAGPTGLACGIELKKRGIDAVLFDKGCVVNSIYNYPAHMVFFTTPELLEIGSIPMTSLNDKPVRGEALKYYRRVADHYKLDVRQYEAVTNIEGRDGAFRVVTPKGGYDARKIILATGYYDRPNLLNVPGENLKKVIHYYTEAHPYFDQDVLVVGAKNSAAIVALELWWTGARVTMVYRNEGIHKHVKYWIKPNIENRIKNGEIRAYPSSRVVEILPHAVRLDTPNGEVTIKNDFVFAMTGYHPDFDFLTNLGVHLQGKDLLPVCDPESLESNVPGVYLAGVIVAGSRTNEIFIENGRFHGRQIAGDLRRKLSPDLAAAPA
jgi:thioredoxin reductase (NADPH)